MSASNSRTSSSSNNKTKRAICSSINCNNIFNMQVTRSERVMMFIQWTALPYMTRVMDKYMYIQEWEREGESLLNGKNEREETITEMCKPSPRVIEKSAIQVKSIRDTQVIKNTLVCVSSELIALVIRIRTSMIIWQQRQEELTATRNKKRRTLTHWKKENDWNGLKYHLLAPSRVTCKFRDNQHSLQSGNPVSLYYFVLSLTHKYLKR